jgi:site-specific recombinase XerD
MRSTRVLGRRLGAHQVARIVQKRAAAVGLDPTLFALRSGYISSAADHGASLQAIADHAAHKKLDTTRGYVQVADAFRDHSGKGFL